MVGSSHNGLSSTRVQLDRSASESYVWVYIYIYICVDLFLSPNHCTVTQRQNKFELATTVCGAMVWCDASAHKRSQLRYVHGITFSMVLLGSWIVIGSVFGAPSGRSVTWDARIVAVDGAFTNHIW